MKTRAFSNLARVLPRLCAAIGQGVVLSALFESIAMGSAMAPMPKTPFHTAEGSGSQSVFVQRFRPEDLVLTVKEPVVNGRSIKRHMTSFLHSIGSDAATYEAFQQIHTAGIGRDLRADDISRLYSSTYETGTTSTVAVSEKLRESTARQVSSRIMSESALLKALSGGMRFNLNFSSFGKKTEAPAPSRAPDIRYGLVLKSIEPSFEGERSAAVGEFRPEDLTHAGKARPIWGIGPVYQEAALTIYRGSYDSSSQTGWAAFLSRLPRPDFSGNIVPKAAPNLSGGSLPPMLVTLDQAEGLYRVEYHTGSNFKKESVLHAMSLPFYERMRLGQTFTEEWDVQRVSVENVFNSISGPRLNVHHLTTSERYQSDLLYNFETTQIILTSDAPQAWKPGKSPDERYEFKIQKSF